MNALLNVFRPRFPRVVRCILTGRHFAGLQNIMNINEVQRSNGVTRRNLVVEWCGLNHFSIKKDRMMLGKLICID